MGRAAQRTDLLGNPATHADVDLRKILFEGHRIPVILGQLASLCPRGDIRETMSRNNGREVDVRYPTHDREARR